MLVEREGRSPVADPGACVGPTAVLRRDVRVAPGAQVRINGVVHVDSGLVEGAVVPIGWIAVGDPAEILPPDRHDDLWAIQRQLDVPGTVLGIERGASEAEATRHYVELFGRHCDAAVLG